MVTDILTAREYICPGHRHAIPHHVHLARIAIGFDACRDCPCRSSEEALVAPGPGSSTPPVGTPRSPSDRSRVARLFQSEGIRGVYRNELTLADAADFSTAFAATLWEDLAGAGHLVPVRGWPVVVGYDERPWSMDVAVAAGDALRRAGCETIDVGLVTGPAFRFAVDHLDAAGGVMATGAGGGPAVAGLDFVSAGGRPLSSNGGLDRLHQAPPGRLTRRSGGRRAFDANVPYEATLRRHFQDPFREPCLVATSSILLQQRLHRLGKETATGLIPIPLPRRSAGPTGPDQVETGRIAAAVHERRASFGIWLDENGSVARPVDRRGQLLSIASMADLLVEDALRERPTGVVALDWPLADAIRATSSSGGHVVRSSGTAEAMAITMADHNATIGLDSSGRVWLPGPPSGFDGLVALGRIARALINRNLPT